MSRVRVFVLVSADIGQEIIKKDRFGLYEWHKDRKLFWALKPSGPDLALFHTLGFPDQTGHSAE